MMKTRKRRWSVKMSSLVQEKYQYHCRISRRHLKTEYSKECGRRERERKGATKEINKARKGREKKGERKEKEK